MARLRPCRPSLVPRGIRATGLGSASLLGLFAVVTFAALFAEPASAYLRVVLDPGHGGDDKGANYYGVYEKDLNLDLARRVQTYLKKHKDIAPVLTRTSDRFVSLEDRAAMSNRFGNTIFVSIHFNATFNRSITGIESFYYGSSSGRRLATAIQSSLMERMKTTNRGVKSRQFKVLRTTNAPAALIECGFLSNSWERKRCASPWLRDILAQQIAQGIVNYYHKR